MNSQNTKNVVITRIGYIKVVKCIQKICGNYNIRMILNSTVKIITCHAYECIENLEKPKETTSKWK